MVPKAADVVVVGGGLAGAATAYHLVQQGISNVVVLEQEDLPGRHASGRNAGMARFVVTNPDQLPLVLRGIAFLKRPPAGFPAHEYFQPCGSLMLTAGPEAEEFRRCLPMWQQHGIDAAWLGSAEIEELVPATRGGTFIGGIYSPGDGVVDIAALLDGFLRCATAGGARILTRRTVTAIRTEAGRVCGVETDQELIKTALVVNAAGAWANALARLAGACELPMRPLRRHLAVTSAPAEFDRSWPFVWDVTHQVYFRPEPPGLLMSPCDTSEQAPGPALVDPSAVVSLAEKIEQWLPRLKDVSISSVWAGLRTMTPDGNLIVGPDPRVGGFVWCAGLGGNGVTTSPVVGSLAARAVLGEVSIPAHDPRRLAA